MTDPAFTIAQRSPAAIHTLVAGLDLRLDPGFADRLVRLPLAPGARITLVHILEARAGKPEKHAAATTLRASAAGIVARRADLSVEVSVPHGDVASELARAAQENGAELIVLRRGVVPERSLFPRSGLAERVVRRCPVPVLLLGWRYAPYARLLALLERSGPGSEQFYELARRMAGGTATHCDVVHPVTGDLERRMRNRGAPRHAALTARRWLRATRTRELRSWLGAGSRQPLPRLWTVYDASPKALEDLATRAEPDLLAICVDRGWLRGLLRAGVAGRLIAATRCDVLLGRYTREAAAARVSHTAAA